MYSVEFDLNENGGDLCLNNLEKNGLAFQFVNTRAVSIHRQKSKLQKNGE